MIFYIFEPKSSLVLSVVLILGSAPNVMQCRHWPRGAFDRIVAINNAWAVRPDWDDMIHPEDFPPERKPVSVSDTQRIVTAADYVPVQNDFGGFVYAGGTMAFTTGYWALGVLRPRVIAMLGCDMVYPTDSITHFYGEGEPDPLREDITLRDLRAKSARMMIKGAQHNCAFVNLSQDESRLVFPRATPETVAQAQPAPFDKAAAAEAEALEQALNYTVPSGRYWEEIERFDLAEIDRLDALWLKAAQPSQTET